jgi:hypothetical protein
MKKTLITLLTPLLIGIGSVAYGQQQEQKLYEKLPEAKIVQFDYDNDGIVNETRTTTYSYSDKFHMIEKTKYNIDINNDGKTNILFIEEKNLETKDKFTSRIGLQYKDVLEEYFKNNNIEKEENKNNEFETWIYTTGDKTKIKIEFEKNLFENF